MQAGAVVGKRARRAAGLAVVLVAVLALAAPAATPVSTVSQTVDVAADATASAGARCPQGTRLSGLGFETTTNTTQGTIITSMVPGKKSVSTTASEVSGDPGELTASGYCARAAKPAKRKGKKVRVVKLRKVSATTPLSGTMRGEALATCPRGTRVRSGGFRVGLEPDGSPAALISALELVSPRQWRATADSPGGPASSITAVAICGAGPKLRAATASRDAVNPVPFSATAVCPAGKTAFFGGFREGGATLSIYPSRLERASDSSFRATAYPFSESSLTAIAYCG